MSRWNLIIQYYHMTSKLLLTRFLITGTLYKWYDLNVVQNYFNSDLIPASEICLRRHCKRKITRLLIKNLLHGSLLYQDTLSIGSISSQVQTKKLVLIKIPRPKENTTKHFFP